ncbi:MAG TPA: hypothetical protein VFG05_08780 [Methylocella sp.]|nr:hypothetical protein [Methylocella sp.]
MGNFFGLDTETIDMFRLTGLGYVIAIFIVGGTLLLARYLVGSQIRRIERKTGAKLFERGEGK